MSVSIRPARLSDADDIARLTTELGYDIAGSDVAPRLSRFLESADHHFLIAEIDGHPVGWLHATLAEYVEAGRFVVVAGLVVDSRHRRKRVGSALMERAEQWAVNQGCSMLRLWSSSGRAHAHRFYEHLGFTHIKTQFSFVKSLGSVGETLKKLVPRIDE